MAKILEVIKRNLVSIICGVIALVAIGALYYPVSGYYAGLRTEADKRVAVYNSLKGLKNKPRTLPQTDLSTTAAPQPLEANTYPTRALIDSWKKVTDRLTAESTDIYKAAIEINKSGHDLLDPEALPTDHPVSQAALGSFRTKYRAEMDTSTPDARKQSMVGKTLSAGAPPTQMEIEAAKAAAEAELRKGAAGFNPETLKQSVDEAKNAIPDQLRKKVAKESRMYAQFDQAAPIYPELAPTQQAMPPDFPSTVFRAQLTMWIQKDILNAIAAANKDATDVSTAAVKHLFSIKIYDSSISAFGSIAAAGATPPPAPTTEPSQDLPKNPNLSLTGRKSNGVFDVIKFSLRVFVDAEQVPRVLQELSRNQFITVTNVNMQTVDLGRWQSFGYLYGDKPLVQLDLTGEELLMRAWTTPLMPAGVKQALGIPLPAATPAAPAAQ